MRSIYRAHILEDKLEALLGEVSGIRGAVIVSVEGFVIASYPTDLGHPNGSTQTPQVAAMAATMISLGEQTLGRLEQGGIERLMLEGEEGAMIVYPINRSAALAILISKSAKIGLTLLAVSKAASYLATILGD